MMPGQGAPADGYIEETPNSVNTIIGVPTSITVFLGRALTGPVVTDHEDGTEVIYSFADYERLFGGLSHDAPISYAVRDFFLNGGGQAVIARLPSADNQPLAPEDYVKVLENGVLDQVDIFNLLCIPPDNIEVPTDTAPIVWSWAAAYCVRRRAMVILDSPVAWTDNARQGNFSADYMDPTKLGIEGDNARNAAVYFPRVVEADPLLEEQPRVMPACGVIAGVMASTDATRGVWKAPAGIDAGLNGIIKIEINLTDDQNGLLNPLGINCLRSFPVIGPVVWGARTLRGADQLEDDYKYITVRRLTLYIEESIYRGTKWAVFEPNADPLWTSLRLSVNSFLADLQRQGAFYSYFVNCDNKTTTPDDIALGIVNIIVGIAPVDPAEFVIIEIQQTAGQTS
jgi:phage tail sheath protein FI